MERREALRYTAYALGLTLSGSAVSALMAGCQADPAADWTPAFFTADEIAFLRELAETMLPRTTTPGAADALVDRFLDAVRPLRYTAEENEAFKSALQGFMEEARQVLGKPLSRVDAGDRLTWLTRIDQEAYQLVRSNPAMPASERPFYLQLKEQVLGAYFNAEIVAKEFFAFDPIPGRYDPCIPFSEVGKAWAL